MSRTRIGVGAAAMAAAAALGFAGTAQAVAPVNAIPAADNTLCGNVYAGTWVENGAPPSTATALQGATVSATVYDKNDIAKTTQASNTNATGGYCITDTSGTLKSTVLAGGYVVLTATSLPAGHTINPPSSNPWATSGGQTKIDTGVFLAHQYGGLLSSKAYQFHFATT